MPARWEDDTLPRASVPSPADQEDRDELMARIGQRHREAVRTSRSEELHARLAKHAKAVAAIEAERAALDVQTRGRGRADGPSAANAVARAACPPPPTAARRGLAGDARARAGRERRLRRRVAELTPIGANEKLRRRSRR